MVLFAYIAWATAAALKLSTVARMSWNGLVKRFPWVAVYLGFCAIRSIVLMYLRGKQHLYATVHTLTQPLGLLAEGVAILAIFWAVAENYPKFRTFGSLLLTILGIGGAIAAWATITLSVPNGTVRDTILLLQQSSSIFMVIILAGSRLALPRSDRFPIPKVAQRAADIFLLDVIAGVLMAYITRKYGFSNPPLANTAPLAAELLISVLWLVGMNPAEQPTGAPRASGRIPDSDAAHLRLARGR